MSPQGRMGHELGPLPETSNKRCSNSSCSFSLLSCRSSSIARLTVLQIFSPFKHSQNIFLDDCSHGKQMHDFSWAGARELTSDCRNVTNDHILLILHLLHQRTAAAFAEQSDITRQAASVIAFSSMLLTWAVNAWYPTCKLQNVRC